VNTLKVIFVAAIVMIVIATASELVLTRFVGESSERVYTARSARP
jgi:hypothetical protein